MDSKITLKLERLISGASVLIVLLLIVNYLVSISNVHVITKQVDMIANHPFPVSRAAGEVNTYAVRLRAQAKLLEDSHTPERVEMVRSAYDSIDENMGILLNRIKEQYITDSTMGYQLTDSYEALRKEQDALIGLCLSGNADERQVQSFILERIYPCIDQMEADTDIILANAEARFTEFEDKAQQVYTVSLVWTSVLVVAVLLLMFLYRRVFVQKRRKEEEMSRNLRVALDAAQSANEAKSQFLTNMSHDIRTPLNAIVGMTAIAAAHLEDTRRVKDCLGKITVSSRHLLGLINDVLDMSRIESGKIVMVREPFSLPDFIQNFLVMVQPQARARQLEMDISISNISREEVIGDSMRLNQILLNIVGNSVKFTAPGGKIKIKITEEISSSEKLGQYCFMIEDTGCGMSAEFLQNLFQPFERERTSTISCTEGTGLGMAITKNLVELMGGEIYVGSEQGKGTRFRVLLPLEWKETNSDIRIEKLRSLRAMVVDDDQDVCENTVQILSEIGMTGTWVTTGEAAVEQAVEAHHKAQGFHTIIMDWKLPGISGIEATRQIRRELGRDIPIILLTAYDWSEIEEEARAAGVTAFLSKPLFKSSLYQIMQEVTGESREQAEAQLQAASESQLSGRALLVEDNQINSEISMEILKMSGLDSEQAWDGEEAVEKYTAKPQGYYQLILMDIQMPRLDGYGATQQIRSFERKAGRTPVPIVAMTANAFSEDMKKARDIGMDEYITKPVDVNEVRHILKKLLS